MQIRTDCTLHEAYSDEQNTMPYYRYLTTIVLESMTSKSSRLLDALMTKSNENSMSYSFSQIAQRVF